MRKLDFVLFFTCAAAAALIVVTLRFRFEAASSALCSDVPCGYFNERMGAIESSIRDKGSAPTYLAIGDSITERADLDPLCGNLPINAGIGWATVETFETQARRLADLAHPKFIVLALGTNNALRHKEDGFGDRMTTLIASPAKWPVVVVPLPPGPRVADAGKLNAVIAELPAIRARPLGVAATTEDGVHLSAASYVAWKKTIADAIPKSICP